MVRGGEVSDILASEWVPGDVVLLEEGDFVPADCRLIEAFGGRVNTVTLKGESLPKIFNAEPHAGVLPLAARNLVLAGTSVVSGQARAVVYATGMRTEFGRIAHLTQTAGAATSPQQREIARLSRIVAFLATGLDGAFFFIGQALGSTAVILSDKTGTLTQNRLAVRRMWLGGGFFTPEEIVAQPQHAAEHRALFANAALCHNLKLVDHPLCRHPIRSAFSFGLLGNPLILFGIVAELALLVFIVYTPLGDWLFGTTAMGAAVWLALFMLCLEEARKARLRHSRR